jgi:hypothetical protein
MGDFSSTAARKDGEDFVPILETVFFTEKFPSERGVYVSDERVANDFYGDAGVGIKLFFEGEDAEGFGETAADEIRAPGAPGPELGADVINVSNAFGTEFAREAEMEAREIGEDGEGRLAAGGFVNEMVHGANQGGQAFEDFGDADDANFRIVGNDFDAGGAHLGATHAEERDVHALL